MSRAFFVAAAVTLLGDPATVSAGPLSCAGGCSIMVFGGPNVGTSLHTIAVDEQLPPDEWKFGDSYLLGLNASKRIASLFEVVHLEAELGAGQRLGALDETEFWGALYVRYTAFPWNRFIRTTVAVNTGLNYATETTQRERESSPDGEGDRLLHYFGPEVTFALPSYPQNELVFRFHHRSGAFGFVSDTEGGEQFATVGFRRRF
jgi:hypothetical protein